MFSLPAGGRERRRSGRREEWEEGVEGGGRRVESLPAVPVLEMMYVVEHRGSAWRGN